MCIRLFTRIAHELLTSKLQRIGTAQGDWVVTAQVHAGLKTA